MVSYLSNHPNILSEARREALGDVLGIAEIVEAAAVQVELQMLEEQCQLEDRYIGSCQGPFLEWSRKSQRQKAHSQREYCTTHGHWCCLNVTVLLSDYGWDNDRRNERNEEKSREKREERRVRGVSYSSSYNMCGIILLV